MPVPIPGLAQSAPVTPARSGVPEHIKVEHVADAGTSRRVASGMNQRSAAWSAAAIACRRAFWYIEMAQLHAQDRGLHFVEPGCSRRSHR